MDRVWLDNLLLVGAGLIAGCMVIVTTVLARTKNVGLTDITSAGEKKSVAWNESWTMLRDSKHLQIIAAVIALAAMGAALVDQQLSMAVDEFVGEGEGADARITALLATVQLFTSTVSFIVQIWLTARIHRYLGIGVALLLLPISLGGTAIAMLLSQQLWSAMLARTVDTSLRYSVDKTSREILFMPLPSELKYRAKPFVDVTVDRVAKSAVHVLILVLIQPWGLGLPWPFLSVASLILLVLWVYMSIQARDAYLAAFRRSIEQRDVQPAEVRLDVADLSTVEALVEELAHPDEGRTLYAIDMLESLDKRNLVTPLLLHHDSPAVRARALSAMGSARTEITRRWSSVIEKMVADESPDVRAAAIGALARVNDQDASTFARTLLTDDDPRIVATAAVVLSQSGDAADEHAADRALSSLAAAADQSNPQARRDLAAAIRQVDGADCRHILIPLLHDSDPAVAAEAMRSVRALPSTDNLFAPTLISLLGNRRLKSGPRETLVGYGEPAIGMLGHFLSDRSEDIWVRRHIPAKLARIPHQASMDILVAGLDEPDGFLRFKVLSAIQKLSRANPELTFRPERLEALALKEGRSYFTGLTLYHNLFIRAGLPASSMLAVTLDQKIHRNVDRVYRVLGLLYPWKDIAAARWAIERADARARSSAFEYLDNILGSPLRTRLMPVLEEMPLDDKVRRANVVLKTRPRNVEETLLQLINDDDQVVAAAAIDLIREKEIWGLTDDVEFVLEHRDANDWYVLEAASWTLASRRLTSERRRELWLDPLPAAALVGRLRGLPMFASVSIDELFRIAGAGHQTRHETATTLLQEGAVPDALHVLLDGRIVSTARDGEPGQISPPVTRGFEELLKGNLMARTVKTLEPCVTLRLGTDQMRTLLADNTDLVRGFFRTLAGRGLTGRKGVIKGHVDAALVGPGTEPLTPIQKVLAMQRVPVFSRVSATEMRHLAATAHQVELVPAAIVSAETDPPVVCVVLSGAVSIETPGDETVVPSQAEPRDVTGLFEALAGQDGDAGPAPRRLRVAQAGTALRIDRDDLYDLLGQRPDLLQQIFTALFGKRRRSLKPIVEVDSLVPTRLAGQFDQAGPPRRTSVPAPLSGASVIQTVELRHKERAMQRHATVTTRAVLFVCALSLPAGLVMAQTATPLEQEVRDALRKERSLRGLDVGLSGSEVTLTGELDSFWQKSEAIRRALDVDGVETVATAIEIPPPEGDEELAEEVSKAVQNYPHYSLFDHLEGAVDNGVVSLWGRVTPDRNKPRELFERVAKIRGVQEVRNDIQTMTPSTGDTNLRRSLSRQIFQSTHFERFRNARNPPFHIVVERSSVTLVGWVQGEIERREMEQIARMTQGVIGVDNQLQTIN